MGKSTPPKPTGDLAYRIVLTVDQMRQDREIQELLGNPGIRIWIGPGSHAVAYNINDRQILNLVLLVPDTLPDGVVKAHADIEEMMKLFEGWDPLLTRTLENVEKVEKWRLSYLELENSWRSQRGNFVLAGDSCHPILPYMAQGANA